jgi:type IV pilus assembly protein PilV
MTVKQNKPSSGFTLLEVLIALLIISIGLLGVATLQIRGQQFNQVSYFRTQATFLAYDLMDRIRVNFAINGANMASYGGDLPAGIELSSSCDDSPCNSVSLRNYDLNNWLYYLRDILPNGRVTLIPNAVDNYTITISWKDIVDDKEEAPEQQTWVLQL